MKRNLYPRSLMRKRKSDFIIFLATFLLISFNIIPAHSQINASEQNKVSGKITDATTGEPLVGVSVMIKGTTAGTLSSQDGKFSIDVPSKDHILLFSYLGYTQKEIRVGEEKLINVSLARNITSLHEVVAIGYGSQEKRDVTGAISSIHLKDINNTPVHDVLSAMQGRLAGVQVVSNSGAPGDGIQVIVRGESSLNAGNSPLYIIDGIPVDATPISQLNGQSSDAHALNPLAFLNPSDIASIEVLKDAASTAIYGSRAANGVVIITTKRGRLGKPRISLNYYTGVSTITRHLDVLNAAQWRSNILDSYHNLDIFNNAHTPTIPSWTVIDSLNPMNTGDVDWQKVMYRVAPQKQLSFSVSGGTDKVTYALSSSLLDQDGIFIGSNYRRITSSLNATFYVTQDLKIGYNIIYANELNNRIFASGDGNNSLVQSILVRPPTYSLTYPDGSPIYYFFGKRSPVGMATQATHLNTSNRVIGEQYLEYQILRGLKFRTSISLDFTAMTENQFLPSTIDYRPGYNLGSVRSTTNLSWINENYLTYDLAINNSHFSALAGFSEQNWKQQTTGLDGMYFVSDELRTLNGAGTISNQAVNVIQGHGLASFYGRIGYTYKDKYLLQANMRADGSSRFGKDRQFGYFPSLSVGWRFSSESFMEKYKFLNDGKLRLSVGETGNEAIGNYTSQGEFSVGTNYLTNSGASPSAMPNLGLTWEKTTQYDAGIDLSMFNYRVSFTADVYLKNTTHLLFAVPIPETTGFGDFTQNIGEVQNKGIEFSLTTNNLTGRFKWNTNFNISFNRNEVISLPKEVLTNGFIQNGPYEIIKAGQPIGTFYGYKFLGVYPTDASNVKQIRNGSSNGPVFNGGDPIWNDLNGDGIINAQDEQILGNAQPKFIGGFNNDFSYDNFSLSIFYQFSYGNDIYSVLNQLRNSVVAYNNVSRDALQRWEKPGDITNFPKPIRNDPLQTDSRVSSRWVDDGSYLKLKSVRLSYSFPNKLINRIKLSSLDLYISGENLLTWTRYTGYDPDVSTFAGIQLGVDDGSYPMARTFIFGINIGF